MSHVERPRRPSWRWFNWVSLAFFFVLGPGLLTAALVEAIAMASATGRVTAVVTAVRESRISSSSPVRHCPTLRWSHGAGTFEREMPTCLDEAVAVGSEVSLRIDPDDPSVAFMDSHEATTGRVLQALVISAFGLVGFAIGLRSWWRASRPPRPAADPA